MKEKLIQFLVSKLGGIVTPIIAAGVSWVVAKIASFDPNLASSVDQTAIVAFVWAGIMSGVNYFTNAKQTQEVKKIQAVVNVQQDGWFGPETYTEVRRAIPVKKKPTVTRRKR
jgi:hypothetical protein